MPKRSWLRVLALIGLCTFVGAAMTCSSAGNHANPAPAATSPAALTEEQKINLLIDTIADLHDAKFVRKGTEYDAATAAQFLRGKRDWMKDRVKTANDFIDMASGGNMGTGDPYFVKYADGRVVRSRDILTAELARIENREVVANH